MLQHSFDTQPRNDSILPQETKTSTRIAIMRNTELLAAFLFSVLVTAAPLQQRAIETKVNLKVTTQVVYTTVTIEPGQPIPTQQPENAVTSTSSSTSTVVVPNVANVHPTPPSSSSSSTSTYTPPVNTATNAPTQVTTPAQPVVPTNQPPASTSTSTSTSTSSSAAAGPTGANPPSGAAGSIGEKHTNVRFSPISNYNDPHGASAVTKIETWGGCATYGQPPEYKMSDAAGNMRVALDANVPNFYAYCGKTIRLTNPDGRTAVATIVDKCPGCGAQGGPYSLDLLEAPWQAVGNGAYTDNVYGAKWEIIA